MAPSSDPELMGWSFGSPLSLPFVSLPPPVFFIQFVPPLPHLLLCLRIFPSLYSSKFLFPHPSIFLTLVLCFDPVVFLYSSCIATCFFPLSILLLFFFFRHFLPSAFSSSSQHALCFSCYWRGPSLSILTYPFPFCGPFGLFSLLALCRAARVFYIWKEPLTKSAGILVSFPPQSFHVRRALTLPVVENYLGTTSSPPTSSSFRTQLLEETKRSGAL